MESLMKTLWFDVVKCPTPLLWLVKSMNVIWKVLFNWQGLIFKAIWYHCQGNIHAYLWVPYAVRFAYNHDNTVNAVFCLKFFRHPSFGQVAHEIYPSEWKVYLSEISITNMYCWYMFLIAVGTYLTHVTILINYLAAWVIFWYLIKGHVEKYRKVSNPYGWMLTSSYHFFLNFISAAEMPVKFQSNWKTRRGLAKTCDRTSHVILNQLEDMFSVQQTQVW